MSTTTTAVPSVNLDDREKETETQDFSGNDAIPYDSTHETASSIKAPSEKEVAPSEKEVAPSEKEVASSITAPSEPVIERQMSTLEKVVSSITRRDTEEYPSGIKLLIITVALCMAVLLVALDNTIIATAIPRITDHFQTIKDVGWYGAAYLLTTCSFQLMFGKFYTYFDIKWVFLIAITIFEIGSAICGAAPTSTALVIGRAIAGVGCSGIFSGALIIVAHTVPLHKRPAYTGLIGAMYGVASVAGPLMGGAFTDHVSWRWCFYINLPVGAVTIVGILIFFQEPKREKPPEQTRKEKFMAFDPYGTIVFLPGIVCLLLALTWGGSTYDWDNARIIVLFILFGVLIMIFIYLQHRQQERSTVPPRIIKQRSVLFSSIYAFANGSAFFTLVYYVPIWFQAIKGVSATKSGIMSLPMILGSVIASVGSGLLVTKIGFYWPFMIIGSILASIGAGLLTTWESDTHHSKWIGYQFIYGFGVGSGMQIPLMVVQTVLPLVDIPIGTSVIVFVQTLGGSLFVTVAQNIFSNELLTAISARAPEIAGLVLQAGATEIQKVVPKELLPAVKTSYNIALTHTWYAAVALSCICLIGALGIEFNKSVKGKKIEAVGGA